MATSIMNLASMFSPGNLLTGHPKVAQTKPNAATAGTSSSTTTGTSGTSDGGLDGTSTGQTFLNLLVKELQNQDPTSPMDSTAMVGQMISLNQLDQLISINQVLSTATGTTSTTNGSTKSVSGSPALSSSAQMAARAALLNSTQNGSAMQTAMQAASDPTKALDLSTLQIPNGGK